MGAGFISAERGRGFPVTGDINNDGLADFVMPAKDMFHVGIATISNGHLMFTIQPIEYYNTDELLYRAYMLDMNEDDKDDCFMLRDDAGECCPPLIFHNENFQLSNSPIEFIQPPIVNENKFPVHLNSDNIVDTFFTKNGDLKIIDGHTGIIHSGPWNGYLKVETFQE